jgi:hypothetical protein
MEVFDSVEKKTRARVKISRIKDQDTIDRAIVMAHFNTQSTCNNELLEAFGLQGEYMEKPEMNTDPLYCTVNSYTCCSNSQVHKSQIQFGIELNRLKRHLEPISELGLIIKTENFVTYMTKNIKHPVCSNIIKLHFGKNPLNKNFKLKKFIAKIIK